MHAFLSNLANRQTDKRRQTQLPPPLSEVNDDKPHQNMDEDKTSLNKIT